MMMHGKSLSHRFVQIVLDLRRSADASTIIHRDRVVCVITTGQEWQFRPYKWTEPKELFHHVKGIHFRFTNEPPNSKIANWNVAELKIDPVKRYIDKSTVSDFWRILEGWTAMHKSGVVDF